MRRQEGFTLIELMVVIAILGILAVTAMPFYQTWTQRAYGTQATALTKQLVDAEIMYFLEHNDFYPALGRSIFIPYEGNPSIPGNAISLIEDQLKVKISQSRQLDYRLSNIPDEEGKPCVTIYINSPVPLFKGQGMGGGYLMATVFKEGRVTYHGPP
jgi:prepilin-type N-terminal cleavage/methylation domain-containing protein